MPVNIAPNPMSNLEAMPPLAPAEQQPHVPEVPDYAGVTAVGSAEPWAYPGAHNEAPAAADPGSGEFDARLQHIADGGEITEGDNRMYDVNAAHDAAIQENQNRDLGLDMEAAHQQALDEEKQREAAKPATPAVKTEEEKAQPAPEAAVREAAPAPSAEKAVQAQAEQALGHALPPNSVVEKNALTQELTVKTGNVVQVLEPQAVGGYKTTTYNVNPITKAVSQGNSLLSPALEAAGENAPEGEVITLPHAVAEMVGFDKAVRANAPQEAAPAEAVA